MTQDKPIPTERFLPYMQDVVRCDQSLQELNLMWRLIEASAKMNCPAESKNILPTMAATRSGFSQLEKELVTGLVREKIKNVLLEIHTKARYVIDIVVRNLYERTADVGFLATDKELCAFVAGLTSDPAPVRYRLREYRNKYTVYDEIILLDFHGNVLVQIDPATPLEHSADPLLGQTLARDGWVETFRATDLRPARRHALVYSHRMCHPQTGEVVGVLCLCFNFEEEMQRIFEAHRDSQDRFNMLLLNGRNQVIASADPVWIPTGVSVPANRKGDIRLMLFAGREYLVQTIAAQGYQGYPGPVGWQGQVMIPVDIAFETIRSDVFEQLPPALAQGMLSHARTFCPPLFDIMSAAHSIQRIVWNGQVMTAGQRGEMLKLKTILEQISETGHRSNALFAQSIHDLYQTALTSRKNDAIFTTRLLVDLLDRNLYERANDCRWWALTPELCDILSQQDNSPQGLQKITAILSYINSLYTVYTCLFVYDRQGCIIAATGHAAQEVIGQHIDTHTLEQVLSLRASRQYHVTPFDSSPLYDDMPTYIYHAAIHDRQGHAAVGGIGIVFDATPQLHNMLQGGISGKGKVDAFYVSRTGCILSSTNSQHPVGSTLAIATALLGLSAGHSHACVTTFDGQYAVIAATMCSGYREFKVTDGYREDVLAVSIEYFGHIVQSGVNDRQIMIAPDPTLQQQGMEYATFFTAGNLLAIAAVHVTEALPVTQMQATSMGRGAQVGVLLLKSEQQRHFVWVFDLAYLMYKTHSSVRANSQIIIVQDGTQHVGLLVDELHAVPQFDASQIMPTPFSTNAEEMFTSHVIQANAGQLLIQCIDPSRLMRYLIDGKLPAPEEVMPHLLAA